ncbi:hypothetical protein DFH09DRAFT_1106160 [Mycena vulgaris]|nr:hypothetical protein DFH09DRAFT_1106160 [Mycena vulgaris]
MHLQHIVAGTFIASSFTIVLVSASPIAESIAAVAVSIATVAVSILTFSLESVATLATTPSQVTFMSQATVMTQATVSLSTTSTPKAEPTFTTTKRRRTFNCNQDSRLQAIEAQAWADAGALAAIAKTWIPPRDELFKPRKWQPAMDAYMGVDSVQTKWAPKISDALTNEDTIHSPNWVFPEAVVDVYCGDTHPTYQNTCRWQTNPWNPSGPKVTAFASARTERGKYYNTYSIILCPRFFEEKISLESILNDMKAGRSDPTNATAYKFSWGQNLFLWGDRHTYYHELMHLNPIIADGKEGNGPHPSGPAVDCNINNTALNIAELAAGPEGIHYPAVNRNDSTYNATAPPDPAPENTPPEDPPTPVLPYTASTRSGLATLATPFDAVAYFATFVPASQSTFVPASQSTFVPASQSTFVPASQSTFVPASQSTSAGGGGTGPSPSPISELQNGPAVGHALGGGSRDTIKA